MVAHGELTVSVSETSSHQLTPGAVKQLPGVSRFYQQINGFPSFARLSFEESLLAAGESLSVDMLNRTRKNKRGTTIRLSAIED